MRILRHYQEIPEDCRGGVVTIGNFDGVHLGHREVLRRAREIAVGAGAGLCVLAFEPHPRSFFQPDAAPFRLTSLRAKAHLLERAGVDVLMAFPFDAKMAGMDAGDFVRDVLVGAIGVTHIVIGHDFRFGKGRGGDEGLLRQLGDELGFGLTALDAFAWGGEICSSSLVRDCIRKGEMRRAAETLGHSWVVEGRVREGDRRGRQLGFPTANLSMGDYIRPRLGVYAVIVEIEEEEKTSGQAPEPRGGVANIGRRPTFGQEKVLLEVHLFGFDQDIYGRHLKVHFADFLRPEVKFDGLEALKAQITKDCARAEALLEAHLKHLPKAYMGHHPGAGSGVDTP